MKTQRNRRNKRTTKKRGGNSIKSPSIESIKREEYYNKRKERSDALILETQSFIKNIEKNLAPIRNIKLEELPISADIRTKISQIKKEYEEIISELKQINNKLLVEINFYKENNMDDTELYDNIITIKNKENDDLKNIYDKIIAEYKKIEEDNKALDILKDKEIEELKKIILVNETEFNNKIKKYNEERKSILESNSKLITSNKTNLNEIIRLNKLIKEVKDELIGTAK